MFSTHIKIIIRNLWKNRVYTTINILGLSIGIAACALILLYVQHELSYDRYNEKANQIVRVFFTGSVQGEKMRESTVMPPVAATLKADYPEVEAATRLHDGGKPVVAYRDNKFRDARAAFVDPNFFSVFTLPLVLGDAQTALQQPNTMVISQTLAATYFGKEDPIGKVLQVESWGKPYTVTGVMSPMPDQSHFHFDLLASVTGLADARSTSWMSSNFYTYLVLSKGFNYKQLEVKLPQVIDKYLGPQLKEAMGVTLAEFRSNGNDLGLHLQPLTDIHLGEGFANDLSPSGNMQYVYVFSAIALFVLLIACINFMNLSTAGATKRAKEVGIRKMMGAASGGLVRQFMLESMSLTAVALCFAVGLVYLALPYFNHLVGIQLSMNPATHPWLLPGLLGVGLVTGFLAGSYPAFFLSSFQPVAVLKGKLTIAERKFGLRSSLVVFQFFISILLVISTLVVYGQLSFIRNKQLGYQKAQVVVLPDVRALGNKAEVFKQQLAQDPRVLHISTSGYLPVGDSYGNNFFVSTEKDVERLVKTLRYDVDAEYIPTLGMDIVSGRNFSKDLRQDSMGVILNETAVKAFGFEKESLGNTLIYKDKQGIALHYQVIGVVRDFHFKSLHEPIGPLVMVANGRAGNLILKVAATDISGLLSAAKTNWAAMNAEEPFSYSFLDERFEQTYATEQKTGLILGIFSGLTILVACLGLFGLAMFTTERRNKEIGIRKVLGASAASIVLALSADILKLVLLALVFAAPVAYWAMKSWLSDFAYRIEMQWWMFAVAGFSAALLAFLTVAGQAVKAALVNPVDSLKRE
ncbi:MAG: ABC transporter permease [Bacteroidota bacterium]